MAADANYAPSILHSLDSRPDYPRTSPRTKTHQLPPPPPPPPPLVDREEILNRSSSDRFPLIDVREEGGGPFSRVVGKL